MFDFDFSNIVVKNEHRKIKNDSKVLSFIGSLCKPFGNILYPLAQWLYSQIFLSSASDEGLDRHGDLYRIKRILFEKDEIYKDKLLSRKTIIYNAASIRGIKALTFQMLNIVPMVIQEYYMDDVFTTGETPLGTAKLASGNYLAFVYKIILPEISVHNKRKIESYLEILSEINFGGNEYIVLEKIQTRQPFTIGNSKLGIDAYLYKHASAPTETEYVRLNNV